MTKTGTIRSVLVIVILLLVGVLGVLGVNTVKTYIGGASADTQPKGVIAKPNDDGKSATVSWVSDKNTVGVVEYGTSPAALLLRAPESESTTNHSVALSPLKPNINYYFRIRIGEEIFDNNGIPYSFKTKEADASVVVLPTIAPQAPAMVLPTVGVVVPAVECKKTEDFNKDGVVNTMDYIDCLRKKPASLPTVPTANVGTSAAVVGKCAADVDYNKDGVINSLDRIKCLQSK